MTDEITTADQRRKARDRKIVDMHEDGISAPTIARIFEISPCRVNQIIEAFDYEEEEKPKPIMRERRCSLCRKKMTLPQFIFTCDNCKKTSVY